MHMNSRFAAALLAATLWQFPLAHAQQTPPPVPSHAVQQESGSYNVSVGDIKVTALRESLKKTSRFR
ncbi:hypothetical protein [Pseudomonas sp. NCHU5232]|uniref:hypothetical protein n=1 Tax=Pseudomonas sp. NCHU5232 TaxID=3451356 RepID=UPI003F96D92D